MQLYEDIIRDRKYHQQAAERAAKLPHVEQQTLLGSTATVVEIPGPSPPTTPADGLIAKLQLSRKDFGGGSTGGL